LETTDGTIAKEMIVFNMNATTNTKKCECENMKIGRGIMRN